MGVELAPVSDKVRQSGSLYFDYTVLGYALLDVQDLGISQGIYISDYVEGRREGTFGICVWVVLTPEITKEGFSKGTLKKLNRYSRELKEEIERLGVPGEVYTSFVRPEREQALRAHLDRNKIMYDY